MEHTEHVYEQRVRARGDAVQQNVPATSTTARHVKYPDSCSDVGTIAESGGIAAFGQLFDGALQGFSVPPCLLGSKVLGRPAQDVPVIGFSGSGEANPPAETIVHPSPLPRSATAPAATPLR